jgi:hypothetical protein
MRTDASMQMERLQDDLTDDLTEAVRVSEK